MKMCRWGGFASTRRGRSRRSTSGPADADGAPRSASRRFRGGSPNGGRLDDDELFAKSRPIDGAVWMKRTWGIDVMRCPAYTHRLRVVATAHRAGRGEEAPRSLGGAIDRCWGLLRSWGVSQAFSGGPASAKDPSTDRPPASRSSPRPSHGAGELRVRARRHRCTSPSHAVGSEPIALVEAELRPSLPTGRRTGASAAPTGHAQAGRTGSPRREKPRDPLSDSYPPPAASVGSRQRPRA
jgi:hypothetical protein